MFDALEWLAVALPCSQQGRTAGPYYGYYSYVCLGYSLYIYDQANGWSQINTVLPEAVIPFRDGIACDFGAAYGLWLWDQIGGWKLVNFADPDKMIAGDTDGDGQDELIASFVGWGLYIYDEASGWTKINSEIPDAMLGVNLMN